MIEYVLCYAGSFTMGAAVGGAIVWYLLLHTELTDK